MNEKFFCDRCGKCCQHLNRSSLYKDLDDGTGVCVYYNKESHLCRIYDHRPEKCDVMAMYKYFSNQLSLTAYLQLNERICRKLKEE